MNRTRTALVLLAATGAALTGCSSSSGHSNPSPTTTTAATAKPSAPSQAALIAQCVAAIAAGKDDSDTGAPECNRLSRSDYYEAIHEANEAAQKAFNDATDAGASATP